MKTTLNQIRAHDPCKDGWRKLLAYLGKTAADDEPLLIVTILDSNGLDDALWCLRAVKGRDREIRLYAVWCARQVQHLMTDPRSIATLDVAERFANGLATEAELAEARKKAWAEAWAAAAAEAWAEAWAAAAAAEAAAEAVDAGAAVEAAAWASARAAREEATRKAQENRLRELCAETEKESK